MEQEKEGSISAVPKKRSRKNEWIGVAFLEIESKVKAGRALLPWG
jgi:hypothetical protein